MLVLSECTCFSHQMATDLENNITVNTHSLESTVLMWVYDQFLHHLYCRNHIAMGDYHYWYPLSWAIMDNTVDSIIAITLSWYSFINLQSVIMSTENSSVSGVPSSRFVPLDWAGGKRSSGVWRVSSPNPEPARHPAHQPIPSQARRPPLTQARHPATTHVPLEILVVYEGMSWSPELAPVLASAPELAPESYPESPLSPLVPASSAPPERPPVPTPPERPQVPAPPEHVPDSLQALKDLTFPKKFFLGGAIYPWP